MQTYQYSVSSDFPNQAVNISMLARSVNDSSISTAVLVKISVTGDNCDITFDDALDTTDLTTLDGIVAVHDGEPFPVFESHKTAFNNFLKLYPIFIICVHWEECKTGKEIVDYALSQGDITQELHDWIEATFSGM